MSVLIAARNAERLVDEMAACVLGQRGVRLELLACDDASTDGTLERLRRWRSDPRVRVLHNPRRLFPAATRNRLLALARGRYCSPCDADDLLLPGALAALVAALDAAPAAGVACGALVQAFADGRPPRVVSRTPSRHWDLFENGVNHTCSLIRTSLLRRVGGYDPSLRIAEDWDLFLRLAERCRLLVLPERLTGVWRIQRRSRSRVRRGREAVIRHILTRAGRRRMADGPGS